MNNQLLLYIRTEDDLLLNGVHYIPDNNSKNICVVFIHGMSGNILENYFAHVLGEKLADNNIGFLYGHNRGYNHINDIATSKLKPNGGYGSKRIGASYERFKECLYDIDIWINEAKKIGYKEIVLMGHSLGCNKLIYYFDQKKPKDIRAIALLSPPDMVGLFEKPGSQPNHKELLEEAKNNVEEGNPGKLVSGVVWDWYSLSSQTYIDLSKEGGEIDNLPVFRKPERFTQLETINVPILGVMGEYDDIVIRSLQEDMDLIAAKAINAPGFTKKFIKGASHTYDAREENLADEVLDWLKTIQ